MANAFVGGNKMSREELNVTSDKKAYKQIMEELEKLYDSYYLKNNGICQYYGECSEEAIKEGYVKGYNSDYAAKVGENYVLKVCEKNIRIVIAGQEALYKKQYLEPPARLIEWEVKVNQHYQETYKILCEMLNYNWKYDSDEKIGRTQDSAVYRNKQDAVLTAYTLTNLYRCAFKKNKEDTQAEHYTKQTENCTEIFRKELDILKPNVLVIQNNKFKAKGIYSEAVQPTDYTANDKLYYDTANDCYIIEMYHPAVHDGRLYKKSVEEFREAVKYLRRKDVLPTEDTTYKLNELARQKLLVT